MVGGTSRLVCPARDLAQPAPVGMIVVSTYAIPYQGKTVIYRPRRHLAFVGNAALLAYLQRREREVAAARNPEIEEFLGAIGYDQPDLECAPAVLAEDGPLPTGAVLLLTNRCNLRCVYCYANAGAEARPAEMDWATAKPVIDVALANARRSGDTPPSLTFHGGGEPTVHWELLTQAVQYARNADARFRISMSSNGFWSEEQRRFICRHFTDVSLSMDGTPAVQNRQRPQADGSASDAVVRASLRALDEAGISYGIRMTVRADSAAELPDGVRLICGSTRARAIQIEPSFTSSRGCYADIGCAFADTFAERFMEAWQIGRDAGRDVYYSGARPWVIAPLFCQAPLKAAVATADGRLVTCFEVFSEQSPLAASFTVGRISAGRVEYERPALQAFLEAQERRRQECLDCFCYWHCCGDCATRRPGPRSSSAGRCRATRSITLAMLLAYMEAGGGVWQGWRESPEPALHGDRCASPNQPEHE